LRDRVHKAGRRGRDPQAKLVVGLSPQARFQIMSGSVSSAMLSLRLTTSSPAAAAGET
jgi:hypothetical protein